MCEQTKQLQKKWKPKAGDYVQLIKNKQIYLVSSVEKSKDKKKVVFYTNIINGNDSWCYLEFFKDNFVYLPTQEQLQEMVKDILFLIQGSFIDLYMSASTGHRDSHIICRKAKSMNELWLMCVMHEKYQKIWTGEIWEEVKTNE